MKVFWSWQNDFAPDVNRKLIHKAIEDALATIAAELGLEAAQRPEIDHDTKGAKGAVDIAQTIFAKIETAAAFIADVTPIVKLGKKQIPNPNVMAELGYALRPGPERVVLVLNLSSSATPDDLPFDLRGKRCMTYSCAPGAGATEQTAARKKLARDLADALKANLPETKPATVDFSALAAPAEATDRAVWAGVNSGLRFAGAFSGEPLQEYALAQGPRCYVRVIPAGWSKGPPSVSAYAHLQRDQRVPPPSNNASNGTFGAAADGYIDAMIVGGEDDEPLEAVSVTKFFEGTGELWSVVVPGWGTSSRSISMGATIRNWSQSLGSMHRFLDDHDALPHRLVEVGLTGADAYHFAGTFQHERPALRRGHMVHLKERVIWTPLAQTEFLVEALTELKGLATLPAATPEDLLRILKR